MTTLSDAQKQVVKAQGNVLVVGLPGSGKTQALLARAADRVEKGQKVALATFSFRNQEYVKATADQLYPSMWGKVIYGTVRDLAASQLTAAGVPFAFATNNQVRAILRALIVTQSFPGTLDEAETLIRQAKGRAKKMAEADKHYPFVQAYKEELDRLGLVDRHDILRMHVIGMKDKTAAPLAVDHLLVDNIQDSTELQLIWLQQHLMAGVKLGLAGDDDVTVFGSMGALGAEAILQTEKWVNTAKVELPATFRLPQTLTPALVKVARQLRTRVGKPEESRNTVPATLKAEVFESQPAEHAFIAETVKALAAEGKTVGVITRTDSEANIIGHALRKRGLNAASFARLIWEEPTPQLILSLLYVMLNQANNGHLHLVLMGFGLPEEVILTMFENGLTAEQWMARGCPLPHMPEASPTTLASAQRLRRAGRAAWQIWQAKKMGPQDVFKALVGELLPNLPAADRPLALLAADSLLSLSGKLTDVLPRIRKETLPDMTSPITVAPVREVRNRAFDVVIIPYCSPDVWPQPASAIFGPNPDHERRTAYLALTRSRGDIITTRHTQQPSPFLAELQQTLSRKR